MAWVDSPPNLPKPGRPSELAVTGVRMDCATVIVAACWRFRGDATDGLALPGISLPLPNAAPGRMAARMSAVALSRHSARAPNRDWERRPIPLEWGKSPAWSGSPSVSSVSELP